MKKQQQTVAALLVPVLLTLWSAASADIQGISGATCSTGDACFNLTARAGHITLGDGNTLLTWGYGNGTLASDGEMQYPGPTLIVNQGDTVSVTLENDLGEPTSIVFPGQSGVTVTPTSTGSQGLMTMEIDAGETVTYTFEADHAGTYMYQSGSHPELQIEMGLVGALIVRPSDFGTGQTAYGMPSGTNGTTSPTAYDREYLFFQSDMDRAAHDAVEQGLPVEPANFEATLWFINGRNGPDTMHPDDIGWLPLQPYGALAQAEPGERVLMRLVGAGIDMHPFHHHGNNAWLIAQDGRVLESAPGARAGYPDFQPNPRHAPLAIEPLASAGATLPDQAISNYTVQTAPGSTYDAIFTWTGLGMNWDIYGGSVVEQIGTGTRYIHTAAGCHRLTDDSPDPAYLEPNEDPNSHCIDLEGQDGKVILPEQQALTFGGLWSGSPYMGLVGTLPPDQGGLNPLGGFSFMWHSHTERELTNDDIFPGGMMTMMIIVAPGSLP
jgi:FtsP/CotA-like multicopper oxidase with cupredoxin domain